MNDLKNYMYEKIIKILNKQKLICIEMLSLNKC